MDLSSLYACPIRGRRVKHTYVEAHCNDLISDVLKYRTVNTMTAHLLRLKLANYIFMYTKDGVDFSTLYAYIHMRPDGKKALIHNIRLVIRKVC
jgi:hypothetical protein